MQAKEQAALETKPSPLVPGKMGNTDRRPAQIGWYESKPLE
jgi:hypothetical protein